MQCVFIQDTAQDGVPEYRSAGVEWRDGPFTSHFSLLSFRIGNAPYRPIPVLGD
jgi:hypothetical protein